LLQNLIAGFLYFVDIALDYIKRKQFRNIFSFSSPNISFTEDKSPSYKSAHASERNTYFVINVNFIGSEHLLDDGGVEHGDGDRVQKVGDGEVHANKIRFIPIPCILVLLQHISLLLNEGSLHEGEGVNVYSVAKATQKRSISLHFSLRFDVKEVSDTCW
jgi:hypothetical protein